MAIKAFWKRNRKLCLNCHGRRARFRYRGVVKWDAYHTLCFRCFRSIRDRIEAYRLAGTSVDTEANA